MAHILVSVSVFFQPHSASDN